MSDCIWLILMSISTRHGECRGNGVREPDPKGSTGQAAMNLRPWFISLLVIWATACDPNSRPRTGSHGKLDLTNLVIECRQLAEVGVRQNKVKWQNADVLPAEVASLSPQFVKLMDQGGATVINIQVSGGFEHRGLLVVCHSPDPQFVPYTGRDWRVTRLAADVFEYRE
jgi:hypothetical protein